MTKCGLALVICLGIVSLGGHAAFGQAGMDSIGVIKAGGTPQMPLAAARASLIAQGEAAVPRIVAELLTPAGSSLTARMNAAVCLAEIAETGKSPQLKDALTKCIQDESPGVRYWGVIGIGRHKDVPDAELAKALTPALAWEQPRLLRLTAVEIAGRRKLKPTLPYIMFMLEKLGADYINIRSETFWPLRGYAGALAATATVAPVAPPAVSWEALEGPPPPVRAATPLVSTAAVEAIVAIAPQRLLQDAADKIENSTEANDMRRIGAAAEAITGQQGDAAWGFTTAPSWQLQNPLVAALAWFKEHRKEYPGGPKLNIEKG